MNVPTFEKGDIKIEVKDKKLLIILGDENKISNVTSASLAYVIDKIEEAIPGDQKHIAGMLKGALGV